MKRLFSLTLVVLMMAAMFAGCSDKNEKPAEKVDKNSVVITVDEQYADDFVSDYAKEQSKEKNGDVKYTFDKDKYEEFLPAFEEEVKSQAKATIEFEYDYWYLDYVNYQLIFGISDDTYKTVGEANLKAQAEFVANIAMKYDRYLQKPHGELEVIFRNTATSETLYSFIYK